MLELLTHRVPPGVDEAAYVKAGFLADVAKGNTACAIITPTDATKLLGTMLGGYNIQPLIDLLDDDTVAPIACKALSHTLLIFDAYHDVLETAKTNEYAQKVLNSWAEADWYIGRDIPYVPNKRQGGVILAGNIAPIFFNTAEDSGAQVSLKELMAQPPMIQ